MIYHVCILFNIDVLKTYYQLCHFTEQLFLGKIYIKLKIDHQRYLFFFF